MRERNGKILITILSTAVMIVSCLIVLLYRNNNANQNRLIKVTTNGFFEEKYKSILQLSRNYYTTQLHLSLTSPKYECFLKNKIK